MESRYKEKAPEPLRTRKILLSLCQAQSVLVKLKRQGNEYEALIDVLLTIDLEDDLPMPSSKELQQALGLSPAKLKKWLHGLYENLLATIRINADVLGFTDVEHRFCVYGSRNFVSFSCRLGQTPRVGEQIDIPFIKAEASGSSWSTYYVYEVVHEYTESKTIITVWARQGAYNKHREYLKDQADFEGTLNRLAQHSMTDYQVEKELRRWYK